MEPHKFFISHYSGDKYVAELFSNALRRITLDQITPWFSSDASGSGGLKPGELWFNQILNKISQSKAVVALITPNSVDRPWVYFETGIGQSINECEVIPVCIGVNRDTLLPPLGLYQCYQLNDYRSVVDFFSKLLTLFGIKFDEEMSKVVVEKLVSEISKISFKPVEQHHANRHDSKSLLEIFTSHIDKRLVELMERWPHVSKEASKSKPKSASSDQTGDHSIPTYVINFKIDFPSFKNEGLFLEIRQEDTFQTITNALYYMLSDYLNPYTYLEQWIIMDPVTKDHVVIREIAAKIPASSIFNRGSKWNIIKLEKPYNATESSVRLAAKRKKKARKMKK